MSGPSDLSTGFILSAGQGQLQAGSAAMPQFRPSSQEWEDYRETITNLYQTQKMTMTRLMSEMKLRYGFNAT